MAAPALVATPDRQAWLEARRRGLGGSDAPAVCGLDPWRTPASVYLEKTGELQDRRDSERMAWGRRLEAAVADHYAELTGLQPQPVGGVLVHHDRPWMLVTPDRLVVHPDRGPGLLEVKTTDRFNADEWADDTVPDRVLIQVQHGLAVTGYTWAAVAVLIGGNRYHQVDVDRDDRLIGHLTDIEAAFWQRVVDRRPPPMDGHAGTADAIRRMFPDAQPGATVDLPPEVCVLLDEYRHWQVVERDAKAHREARENALKLLLGDAEAGLLDGRPAVTWKQITARRLDGKRLAAERPDVAKAYTTQTSYRRFHIPGGRT